ncbi:sigma-70 family RNA polymerase sigma factor [Streptomyces cupreus]|uniref:Sigma-70 family RNA polymerase sigma factor n=1 Tax=Streptomyces cupreus TaxID=2759956 RepID=A0A7X1J6I8_9ACTN|nr:sigma-70 family RNA polymerase sigma factor [Streptomyces cupreus]MBC2904505.1 sigma-70 family RNA polymerase sigma factor [Streptomyces cupreus]
MPGTKTERRAEQTASRGNGPGGRKLERGEIIALTPKQSERLAELYAEFGGGRLERYAARKLMNYGMDRLQARELADDIAQDVWVAVARETTKPLMAADELSEDDRRIFLFGRVKTEVHQYFRRGSTSEFPVDWTDPVTCNTLCPVLSSGCARTTLPAYLDAMVSKLPERERTALLLRLEGMPMRRVAERVGVSYPTANRLVETALLLIQIENPVLSADPVPLESLPRWEREELARMSAAQRAALLRMDEISRRALLLHVGQDLNITEVARRLDVPRYQVLPVLGACATALRSLTADDMEQAA